MQTKHHRKVLRFGDLIAVAYHACGKRRAQGFVRLAVKAHLVAFRGQQRFMMD